MVKKSASISRSQTVKPPTARRPVGKRASILADFVKLAQTTVHFSNSRQPTQSILMVRCNKMMFCALFQRHPSRSRTSPVGGFQKLQFAQNGTISLPRHRSYGRDDELVLLFCIAQHVYYLSSGLQRFSSSAPLATAFGMTPLFLHILELHKRWAPWD
jgi:hypothetical protein